MIAAVPGITTELVSLATTDTSLTEDHAKSETHSVNHLIPMEPVLNALSDISSTMETALLFLNWLILPFTIRSAALRSSPLSTNQKAHDF